MSMKNLYHHRWYFALAILFSVMCIYALLEVKNHRFGLCDFHVYYVAGERMLHGENLYRSVEDGFYEYKYSPVAAIYFIPFSLMSYTLAKISYWLFLSFLVCFGFVLTYDILEPGFFHYANYRRVNFIFFLAALALVVHIARELELGQVNHLLLVIYIGILWCLSKKKYIAGGILAGISIFLKPFGLIFLPWLLIRKEWKAVVTFIGSSIVLAFLPCVFMGFTVVGQQYSSWLKQMQIELSNKESMLADANHTIFSVLARYSPLRMTSFVIDNVFLYQFVILFIVAGIFLWIVMRGKRTEKSLLLEGVFLVALIPLLSCTSYNAFGFVECAVILLLYHYNSLTHLQKWLTVLGMIFTGGNIYELWGRKLWFVFENASLIAVGTILLLVTLYLVRRKQIC
ncbi:MAG TPA: glycosyltransferase family 87 protein [Bacteroidota bacterium]|nr:glycosyltransferase family 87 protein [Bacteroidota bacterium]